MTATTRTYTTATNARGAIVRVTITPWDVTAPDPWVSIVDPADPSGTPAYDGPVSGACDRLRPGMYAATHDPSMSNVDDTRDDIPVMVTVCHDTRVIVSGPRDGHPAHRDTVPSVTTDTPTGDARIVYTRDGHPVTVADVRATYGDDAATMVADGWTVDAAADHVTGTCDRVVCGARNDDGTHRDYTPATAPATATGDRVMCAWHDGTPAVTMIPTDVPVRMWEPACDACADGHVSMDPTVTPSRPRVPVDPATGTPWTPADPTDTDTPVWPSYARCDHHGAGTGADTPCVLGAGHDGPHTDTTGHTWPSGAPAASTDVPVVPSVPVVVEHDIYGDDADPTTRHTFTVDGHTVMVDTRNRDADVWVSRDGHDVRRIDVTDDALASWSFVPAPDTPAPAVTTCARCGRDGHADGPVCPFYADDAADMPPVGTVVTMTYRHNPAGVSGGRHVVSIVRVSACACATPMGTDDDDTLTVCASCWAGVTDDHTWTVVPPAVTTAPAPVVWGSVIGATVTRAPSWWAVCNGCDDRVWMSGTPATGTCDRCGLVHHVDPFHVG